MADDTLDKLIDKLPFLDGSGRRRFVAGGIILIGIAAFNWAAMQSALGKLDLKDILSSPVLAGGAILLIYAIGSIVDMVGELFLVRAASGLFWAIDEYVEFVKQGATRLWRLVRVVCGVFRFPLQVVYGMILGFFGRTKYTFRLEAALSDQARTYWEATPGKVMDGLRQPIGNEGELAIKHIIDRLAQEEDRKWARRLIIRVKEVSATTTAMVAVIIYGFFMGGLTFGHEPVVAPPPTDVSPSIQETSPTPSSKASSAASWEAPALWRVLHKAAGLPISAVLKREFIHAACEEWKHIEHPKPSETLIDYGRLYACLAGAVTGIQSGSGLLSRLFTADRLGQFADMEPYSRVAASLADVHSLPLPHPGASRIWQAWSSRYERYLRRWVVSTLLFLVSLLLLYGGVFISYRTAITAIMEAGMMQVAASTTMPAPPDEPMPPARDTERH